MTTSRTFAGSAVAALAGALLNLSLLFGWPGTAMGQQAFAGVFSVVWGDPRHGATSGGETRYAITLENGATVPLQLSPRQANAAIRFFGKRVSLRGRMVRDARGASSIAALDIAPANPAEPLAPTLAVSGTRRVLYLLLKFSDDGAVPHPPSFYDALTNPDTPPPGSGIPATVNGFFKKTSWNQLSWIGDVGGVGGVPATDWLTLPHPKSYYANCGWSSACAQVFAIQADGMAAGAAHGIDFSQYDNINFVLSNDLDCCAWGGGFTYNNKHYGATWEPPWGQETGTYAHEMGHSLGLPHSGWAYYAYDSPWDVMSDRTAASNQVCGSYYSANSAATLKLYCSEPGDGYIAPYKDYLGWIPAANEIVISNNSRPVTVTLEPDALPLGSQTKMVKVCLPAEPCDGDSAHYLTLEARAGGLGPDSQFDNNLPGAGVLIHDFQAGRAPIGAGDPCFFNNQSGWAIPIDATPGDWDAQPGCNAGGRSYPNYALFNAQFVPGQTYSDPSANIQVAVQGRVGNSFVATVGPVSQLYALSVAQSRSGMVTSSPPVIDCGATCSADLAGGTQVTLMATPAAGWSFAGWSGACAGGGDCTMTMDADATVAALFAPGRFTLRLAKTGNGRIVSAPHGIHCGGKCKARFFAGKKVRLMAQPDRGWSFVGWGGACRGAGVCKVRMTKNRILRAAFSQL